VTRAGAARLLGVSQTALDRWISLGEIPVVTTPAGRREVPVPALLDLLDAVEARRQAAGDRHALGAVLREREASAPQLDARSLLPRGEVRARRSDGHRAAELRALAYHRAVAQRLDDDSVPCAAEAHPARGQRTRGSAAPEQPVRRHARRADPPARARRRRCGCRMKRSELEHIIRAAADVADDHEIVVIGSQAILGGLPQRRMRCCGPRRPTSTRATTPSGPKRSSRDARTVTGWCMEPHDVVLAKCAAGRERDWDFAREAIIHAISQRDWRH
jgi:hypothetical protein